MSSRDTKSTTKTGPGNLCPTHNTTEAYMVEPIPAGTLVRVRTTNGGELIEHTPYPYHTNFPNYITTTGASIEAIRLVSVEPIIHTL